MSHGEWFLFSSLCDWNQTSIHLYALSPSSLLTCFKVYDWLLENSLFDMHASSCWLISLDLFSNWTLPLTCCIAWIHRENKSVTVVFNWIISFLFRLQSLGVCVCDKSVLLADDCFMFGSREPFAWSKCVRWMIFCLLVNQFMSSLFLHPFLVLDKP